MLTDIVGHIGYAFIALGLWHLTKKRRIGWVYRFIGEVIWVLLGFAMHMTSIWGWGLIFMLIDLKGFLNDDEMHVR